jgi:serine phosphatase RsbU (regulator of sigma subunit)
MLDIYPDLAYINNTFLVISIILIVINSIKISWIAFIVKKEKIILLFLSIVISVLFVVNLVNSGNESTHYTVIKGFSASVNQFFNIIMIYGAIYFSILFFTTLFHIPTAEAFDRKAQEVSSLQYFSKLITQVLDFKELAETITDIAIKVSNANASWIVLKENNFFKPIANKNIGFVDAGILTNFLFGDLTNTRSINQSVITLENLINKDKLNENFSSLTVSTLKTHNGISGYLVVAKKDNFLFDDEDKKAITTFSDYASVAIDNSRLLEESIEKERMEKELDLAREIQKKILPSKYPKFEKLNIASAFIPAFEVGGDYFDFFRIDNNRLGFIIADVSGKGISAAFIMAEIKGIFESLSKIIDSPKEILIKVNQILERTLDRKSFVSAAYGIIDMKTEVLTLSRAGHCPIILLRNNKAERIRPKGIGLGLNYTTYFAETLEEIKIELKENDTLVLYTDGITESKNEMLEDFGDINFERTLVQNMNNTADEISNKIIKEITLFANSGIQHDDITLVIFKWKQKLKDGEKEWQILTPQLKTRVM